MSRGERILLVSAIIQLTGAPTSSAGASGQLGFREMIVSPGSGHCTKRGKVWKENAQIAFPQFLNGSSLGKEGKESGQYHTQEGSHEPRKSLALLE